MSARRKSASRWDLPQLFMFVMIGWMCTSVILYFIIDYYLEEESFLSSFMFRRRRETKLHFLMSVDANKHDVRKSTVVNPLKYMILSEDQKLNFYYLPKRIFNTQFTEVTSANRDTSYPLAPDFTFHQEYGNNFVVLYEDYQPGCVYRLYLIPIMPRDVTSLHKLSPSDLHRSYINFFIDGVGFEYSLEDLLRGSKYPFLYPMSATHAKPASGLGAYSPLCYQRYIKITYFHDDLLPPNLFATTVNCSMNDYFCPIHIYAGVSRHSFPIGTDVQSYQEISKEPGEAKKYKKFLEDAVYILENPELFGPNKNSKCELSCVRMCTGCRKVLYQSDKPGVISTFLMRVYKKTNFGHAFMLTNWNHLKLTVWFDKQKNEKPQINRLSLGQLFGATGSLNDFMGAALGHRHRNCEFNNIDNNEDNHEGIPSQDMTGYVYFAMPYWQSVVVELEETKSVHSNVYACFQIVTTPNHFDEQYTGYFHALKTLYADDVSGYRTMLKLEHSWGHIVGVFTDINHLRAIRNVPINERFATLQSDPVLFTDGRKEPTMLGTGLEDYFSYAHGFALAENTTYSFVGNYHAAPKRPEPLTWHCYRLHLLDPIPFHFSVHFLMAGTNRETFQQEVAQLSDSDYDKRRRNDETAMSHMILYYAKPLERPFDLTVFDTITFGNLESEKSHGLNFDGSPETFYVNNKRFLGQHTSLQLHDRSGRYFKPGQKFSFSIKAHFRDFSEKNNLLQGFIVRREFYSPPPLWGQQAKIYLNGTYHGIWNIPMGSTNQQYSLREDDLSLSPLICKEICLESSELSVVLKFEIEPMTDWPDVSYTLIVIL